MTEEVPVLEYGDALFENRGTMIPIRLKLSDQGISYRNIKSGKLEQISADDIEVINWQRLAGSYGIRVFTRNGNLHRFGGFKESDQAKLQKFFKSTLNKILSEKEFSVKGWNFGAAKFEGEVLSFDIANLAAFEIPIKDVSGCNTGKNEVTLEFHQNDDAAVALMEMRFHIPSSELAGEDPVENFQQRIMDKASVVTVTGDALAIFRQVQCLTPRGRYDMTLFPSFIQLHGKTFDFKIPLPSVLKLFLLPHQDGRQHFFVISLDPPLKQGQTRYPYVILRFSDDSEDTVDIPIPEEELKVKYQGRLEKSISGPQFEVISRLFKGLCNRRIVTPGGFVGHTGTPSVSCSYKAAAGYMYPLERGMIYVHKPPFHIRFDEISYVNFARSESTGRSFDLEVECRNGTVHTFSNIEKEESGRLYDYFKDKKLRVKNVGKKEMGGPVENFTDSDEDKKDHYLNRVKAEAEERDEDENSSEEDSDFAPGEEGSDVAEEYDSNASDSSSSRESGEDKHKEKSPKEKKVKKEKTKEVKEKHRKRKVKKDANMPKRPQSAYFLWLNESRESIKEKNPGISITEVSKLAGQLWKEVKDKSKWEEKAVKEKKRYEEAMKEYKATGGSQKSPQKNNSVSSKKAKLNVSSPTKGAGAGPDFKSKEYISDDSSSDDSDKPLKKKVKDEPVAPKTEPTSGGSAAEDEEEEEEEEASDSE